ncbi:MAG: tol-pal system protein YbgF [Desulfuromonadales bacterium]|jgi:tol-pal system protein YbgF
MRIPFFPLFPAALIFLLAGCTAVAPPSGSLSATSTTPAILHEIQDLRQGQDSLAAQMQRLQDNLLLAESRLLDHEQRLRDFRATILAEKVTPHGEKAGATTAPGQMASLGKSAPPTEIYLQAFADYASGRYSQAIAGFDTFLRLHAGNEYAGHAMYWLGECYLAQQQYPTAATVFLKTVDQYPHSGKAPDALLKLAETWRQMDREGQAAEALNRLRQTYPDSAAARRAKELQ